MPLLMLFIIIISIKNDVVNHQHYLSSKKFLLFLSFQQGETAMDIALRKCHNEVQEIIANPPPIKKPDEYQSKQTKTTTKREKENSQGSKDSQGKSRSDLKHKKSKSTGSTRSVHFSGDEHHLHHHHHHGHNKTKEVPTYWSPYGCHLHPDSTDFPKPKLDSLPSDPLNKGEQYYIDLAGNIRKGPVGLSTRCYCAPVLKKVEKKMEKDKQEIIDHIDSTHDNLNEKICNLEKKTQNQLVTLNETVKERLAHEREECTERVQRCALKERIELERRQRLQVEQLKGEVKSWLTNKFENHRRSCQDNIHQQQHHQQQQKFQNQNHQHHHHQQLHNHLYQHENLQQNYSTKPNQMTHQTHERPQSSQDGPLVICGWHKTSIPRSKSEIFLNASGENSEEEPMGQLQGSAVHQMKIEKNSVPSSNSVLDKDILSDTKNKQHQGLLVVADFEKLGARPKDQIKTNEVIQNGITMGIKSGSLLEINNHSNKCENMKTSDIKTTSDINVIHDRDSNRIINDHNQTDLMKSLRCNGTVLTRGEQGDSPFNDSGYHTKFSPSPRDPITTTQNHQTTYAIISKCSPPIKSSLNQHQHNQTSIQYTSAVFEPPIGLPPPVFKSQIFKHRFPVPVIVHSNNKQFNGPNSSLV